AEDGHDDRLPERQPLDGDERRTERQPEDRDVRGEPDPKQLHRMAMALGLGYRFDPPSLQRSFGGRGRFAAVYRRVGHGRLLRWIVPGRERSRSSPSATGSSSSPLTSTTVVVRSRGRPEAPWRAPRMAPQMAATVSVSPPSSAASVSASKGSSPSASARANAATPDSCEATDVPITSHTASARASVSIPRTQ